MRLFFLVLAFASASSLADILPDEVASCRGKDVGAACTTPDGQAGTCAKISVTRPDYSSGIPPTYRPVEMIGCVATAKGTARSLSPWLGVGLAFLAVLVAVASRSRRPAFA